MNKSWEELALRKKVLVAKSTLQRLEIRRDLQGIADSLGWVRTGAKAVGSFSARAGLLGLALRRVAGSPVGQAVAFTSGLVLLSRVASLGLRLLRGSGAATSAKDTP
ncbi:MAG: hypothetical protein ACHQZQ_09275 [SAR324 cluster bacterium]